MEGLIPVFKFLFAVVTLPVLAALTISFVQEIDKLTLFDVEFKAGVLAYVILYFFVAPLKVVIIMGRKLVAFIFRFSTIMSQVVPLFVPVFTVILLVLIWLVTLKVWRFRFDDFLAFFVGVTFAMHIVLTAQSLREEDPNPVKPHYFFVMSWVYLVDLTLVIFSLSLISSNISLGNFFTG